MNMSRCAVLVSTGTNEVNDVSANNFYLEHPQYSNE